MKKTILAVFLILGLTACGAMPSTYDSNEARAITTVQYLLNNFKCDDTVSYLQTAPTLATQIGWLEIYIHNRGDQDIGKMMDTLNKTTTEFYKKLAESKSEETFLPYCEIKVKIMQAQADAVAKAIYARR